MGTGESDEEAVEAVFARCGVVGARDEDADVLATPQLRVSSHDKVRGCQPANVPRSRRAHVCARKAEISSRKNQT